MAFSDKGPCIDRRLIERAAIICRVLRERKLTIIMAESCTAGLVAAALSQAEGASEILHGSFVVYTKPNKATALGVDPVLLRNAGSVNAEVARQMALGALQRSPADIAIAITGVLGPEPDEDGNPVGLVYFGCCRRGSAPNVIKRDYGQSTDEELRRATVLDALELIQRCALEAH